MLLFEYLIDLIIGFGHQIAARIFPFRKQHARPEVLWDIIGIIASTVFATGYYFIADPIVAFAWDTGELADWRELTTGWPVALLVACNLLLTDFGVYWSHRLLHSRWLWSTHAWHHSSRYVYWASGLRGSPIHIVFTLTPATIAFLLFPLGRFELIVAVVGIFHIFNQHYLHSNIRLPAQRLLETVLVTPRVHFVHHSSTVERTNSNYAFIFTIWDRLFGTYVDPEVVPVDDQLGLDYEASNWRLLLGLPPQQVKSAPSGEQGRATV